MIHMLIIWHNDFHLRNPIEYTTFSLICRWISEVFIAHLFGYIIHIVIEAPFNNLTKLYLNKNKIILTNGKTNGKVKVN